MWEIEIEWMLFLLFSSPAFGIHYSILFGGVFKKSFYYVGVRGVGSLFGGGGREGEAGRVYMHETQVGSKIEESFLPLCDLAA